MKYKNHVFDSMRGYSSIIRIGKIYKLLNEHYIYILTLHDDLIDYSNIFKHFLIICKIKMKIRIGIRYLKSRDLYHREIGTLHTNEIFNKYYKLHFGKL